MRCSQVASEESPRKREAAVRADEGVLGDLLGVGAVAEQGQCDGEDPFAVAFFVPAGPLQRS
jgi:hypothetical protein